MSSKETLSQMTVSRQTKPADLRYTPSGKGVIGAIGKPPGFTVVRGDQELDQNLGSGRIGSCGSVIR